MPDITMCLNEACPARWNCCRSESSGTAPVDRRQSYAYFEGPHEVDGVITECRNYWPLRRDTWTEERDT